MTCKYDNQDKKDITELFTKCESKIINVAVNII